MFLENLAMSLYCAKVIYVVKRHLLQRPFSVYGSQFRDDLSDHIIPVCCGKIQSEMQKTSLFQKGERAIQKSRDILIHLEDVIFPKMHVFLECNFKKSDTPLDILEITDIFLILFPYPLKILIEKKYCRYFIKNS